MDIIEPDALIRARYKVLHPDYAAFIAGKFTNESAKILGRKVGLTGSRIDILDNAFGLYLAFFLNFEQMVQFITRECKVDPEQASEIGYALLAGLPDEFAAAHAYAHTIVNNTVHPLEDGALAQEIAEAEAAMEASNAPNAASAPAAIPTYQSSQDSLLGNGNAPKPQ